MKYLTGLVLLGLALISSPRPATAITFRVTVDATLTEESQTSVLSGSFVWDLDTPLTVTDVDLSMTGAVESSFDNFLFVITSSDEFAFRNDEGDLIHVGFPVAFFAFPQGDLGGVLLECQGFISVCLPVYGGFALGDGTYTVTEVTSTAVPGPASALLLLAGLLAYGWSRQAARG